MSVCWLPAEAIPLCLVFACVTFSSTDGLETKEIEMEQAAALIQSCGRTYSASYNLPQSGSRRRKTNMGTKLPSYTDEKYTEEEKDTDTHITEEERDTESDVLMFHGIILRTQLVEMIKNKVFFTERDGVRKIRGVRKRKRRNRIWEGVDLAKRHLGIVFVFHLQPENQQVISYSVLTKDYPRYPSIFQCDLTEEERDKLMV